MRAAIFDWDGTLVNIDEREFYCINQTLQALSIPPVDYEFFVQNYYQRPFEVGTGPRMVLEAALGKMDTDLDAAYETYRKYFAESIDKAKLQDGAINLLSFLKERGFKVGVATMRFTRSVVDSELGATGVRPFSDVLMTREDLGVARPLGSLEQTVAQRVSLVAHALEKLGVPRANSFLVGDSWWDIRAGKRLGMKTVLIETGFSYHNDFTSENPDLVVGSLVELQAVLRNGSFLETAQGQD